MICQKMNIRLYVALIVSMCCVKVVAQEPEPLDSAFISSIETLIEEHEAATSKDKWRQLELMMQDEERWHRFRVKGEMSMDYAGWNYLLKGVIHTCTQHKYISEPVLFQNRHFGKQDYAVALTPLAATWALKAAGVKSTSSWNRLLVANSMALALHVGVTQGFKSAVKETRPNGEDDNSFPSGHTSLAFLSATVLSREYGHLSPWVSIGGYGCATATQFLRMRHNNHWINDTFVGAGIGMMSANFAYFLTDKMLGEDEIQTLESRMRYKARLSKMQNCPSGFKYMMGTEWGDKSVEKENIEVLTDFDGDATVKLSTPYAVGMDVSWYLSQNFAVEGLARMSTAHARVEATSHKGVSPQTMGRSMSMYHFDLAASYSIPYKLTQRIGYRAMVGVRHSQQLTLDSYTYGTDGETISTPLVRIPSQTRFEVGAGMTLDILHSRNHSAGFVLDYYHTFTRLMPNRLVVASAWKAYF